MTYTLLALLMIFTIASPKFIVTKTMVTIVTLLAFAFWYISNMFTGNGVNDAVFYHLQNSSEGVSVDDLIPKIKVASFFIAIILFLIIYCTLIKLKKIKSLHLPISSSLYLMVLISVIFSSFSINIFNATKESFFSKGNAAAVKSEYLIPDKNLDKKYNYVFIYAESLERTFRDLEGENYLPHLSALADNYADFTNIIQPANRGFGWTMAGMVNTQCGIPLVMAQGNAGENLSEFLNNANCVATWLTNQGYNTEFLRGSDKEFAGGDKFFSQHGWSRQDDLNYFVKNGLASPDQISSWGVHDGVLLNHAWMEFDRLTKSQQPFLLSFLTVNTHSPDGLLLSDCKNKVGIKTGYAMLSAVQCSDYLLADFIKKIINSPSFDNTIIVLVSDHLMMENDASALLDKHKDLRRNNFIIIKKGLKPVKNTTAGTLMDVWPTVLDISGSQNKSLGFGRSLNNNEENKYVADYKLGKNADYLAFASDLWGVTSLKDKTFQSGDKLQIGSQKFSLPIYSPISESKLNFLWFEAFAKNIFKITSDNHSFFYANLCKNIGINENAICGYLVSPDTITKLRITPQGIVSSKKSNYQSVFFKRNIEGVSSAPFFMESGFSAPGTNNGLPSGINFLSPQNSSFKIELNYQTCTGAVVDDNAVQNLIGKNKVSIIASSDSIICSGENGYISLNGIFKSDVFSSVQFRQQIIGVVKDGKSEFIKGLPGVPLDAFIDTDKGNLISVCKAFNDC
ncbi:phosphoglycerol transferase I [Rahnella woolbedingensis]|uniref:Phosphoglycerol transferase I n=1 Tax=Rahnella woolbedingensis TaxID=1510574 RepID=A0A419NFI7_9GAMM|nr:phosphoglycerol transferase I [Rahnella woolbedingensis]RJT47646.1 phosphoglycerol transferase I [Rahnella woolbedingensis]